VHNIFVMGVCAFPQNPGYNPIVALLFCHTSGFVLRN
jgi:hypothetical protein